MNFSAAEQPATDAGNTGTVLSSGSLLEGSTAESSRKIVYNANLQMESTDFDAARTALVQAVDAAGGYLENSSLSGDAQSQDRWIDYTARIPVDSYRSFLCAAQQAGSVTSQTESAQDVTSDYIDVTARLDALTRQRDRLNQLADQAETTADLLEVESQLSDVQYQIESYTEQLRAMENSIQYSTVDISLSEVATLTPTGASFGSRIANAFSGGWKAFASFWQSFAVLLIFLLPFLLIAGVALLIVLLVHRQWKKWHPSRPIRAAAPRSSAASPPAGPEAQYSAAPASDSPEQSTAQSVERNDSDTSPKQ
jgi:hypothetical protein